MNTDIINRLNSAIDTIINGYMEAYEGDVEFSNQFEDVLDFKFVIDSNMEYSGVIISESLGGPTIYTNTEAGECQAYWGTETVTCPIPTVLIDAIDEYYSELYEAMK